MNSVITLDRSRPPSAGKPKNIQFPKYFEGKTKNNITVLCVNDNHLPLVSFRIVVKNGSYDDDISGTASLTSELLTKGTRTRTASQIAESVDFLGGVLSSGSDYDACYVSCYSLKKYFNEIFDITADAFLNSNFPEDEIERVKEQRINTLLSYKDEGDYLSNRLFKKLIYKGTNYAHPNEGTERSIAQLSYDNFLSFYKKYFTPSNLIMAFVGDITPDEAMEKAENAFAGETADIRSEESIKLNLNALRNVHIIEKKEAVQSSIKLGHEGIQRNHPDFISTSVLNTLLGGSFTSRINKNLREVNGYTYGARSYFDWKKFSGDFSVETEVKNDLTAAAVTEILKEMQRLIDEPPSVEELQHIQNYITGNFPLQLETPNAIASKLINLKLYNIDDDFYNTYISKVNELKPEDIKKAAEKYLHPERALISIAGNSKEIETQMKQFGEVSVSKELDS